MRNKYSRERRLEWVNQGYLGGGRKFDWRGGRWLSLDRGNDGTENMLESVRDVGDMSNLT